MQERPHKHEVALSEEQRYALHQVISKGKAPARKLAHARVLLKIDRNAPGWQARGQGERAEDQPGLGSFHARSDRYPLPQRAM